MGRKHRLFFPGAKYHITSRGVRKLTLFYDDQDCYKYFSLLEETMNTYPFFLHSYCLMTNHIHLQIETIHTPTNLIIKKLHSQYAKYFNNRYGFSGHLFESRYGAELIDTLEYELDVSKYIHLNPVKAKMVKHPEDYPWSSFKYYASNLQNPLLTTSHLLSYFPEPQSENYRDFINSPFEPLVNNTALYQDFYDEITKN